MSMSAQRLVTVRSSSSEKTAQSYKDDPKDERKSTAIWYPKCRRIQRGRDAQRDSEGAEGGWWQCEEAYRSSTFVGLSNAAQLIR